MWTFKAKRGGEDATIHGCFLLILHLFSPQALLPATVLLCWVP